MGGDQRRPIRRRVGLAEIEGGVTASLQDFWEGRTDLEHVGQRGRGRHTEIRGEGRSRRGDGARLRDRPDQDGDQHLNLVVAHSKESQADPHGVELAAFDPYFERALDPDETVAAGLRPASCTAARACAPSTRRASSRRRAPAAPVPPSAPRTCSPPRRRRAAARARARAADGCRHLPGRVRWPPRCASASSRRAPRRGAARSGGWWTARDLTAAPELAAAAAEALELAGWERSSLTGSS